MIMVSMIMVSMGSKCTNGVTRRRLMRRSSDEQHGNLHGFACGKLENALWK